MLKKFVLSILFIPFFLAAWSQVTIENLLSVPFPSNLITDSQGEQVAWIFNDQGMRNIFIAKAPDLTTKKLTGTDSDNGIELSDLIFSPDGKKIIFTQGNSANSRGEAANPAQLQEETDKIIRIMNSDGSGLRTIGKGTGAEASPDNKSIAYYNKGEIWIAPVDSGKAPVKLFSARGRSGSFRWSPDGKMMTFISSRGDHAFLGIYDLEKNTVAYPDASIDIDGEPVWSPDGKWIAYIRTPNIKDRFSFVELREGYPWSVRLLNVSSGESKEIWKAGEGKGSVLYRSLPRTSNLLLWGHGDHLIFPWEKDGWVHLYSIPVFEKKAPVLLTPGEGIVENVILSADKRSVIYVTNIGDSHRRHVWEVNVNGGSARQISRGEGIEYNPALLKGGFAALRSTATSPGWPVVIQKDGSISKIAEDLFPKQFPEKSLVVPQAVTFKATDGMIIHGQLFLPPNYDPSKEYPALVFVHGGSRRQMLLGFHYMDYYSNDYAMNQFNAINGYITLSVNYRSGIGYGLDFREALNFGANGCSEYNDILGAGLYLKGRKDVDTKKIGIWGGSYGGYLTAMGLAQNSELFAAGVDIHGVHDWNRDRENWNPSYDPATYLQFQKKAYESSPIAYVDGWRSPVLFVHGDDDRNVPFSETVHLAEKLRQRNVYIEQLIFPDEVHTFLLHKNWIQSYYVAEDFFKRMLKKK